MEHPALETEAATDSSNYMIHSRLEILYILRAIQNKNELVTAYFNNGKDFILTSIIDVDGDAGSLTLDFGADEIINRRALASDKIILVTAMDRVKVQFVVDGMKLVEHLGRPAFKAAIPRELLKLQRREYYRLSTPVINPIKCAMTKAGVGKVEATIADISLGGIAITDGQNGIAFEIGDKFSACRIVLPEIGTVTTEVEIRNVHENTLKNGAKIQRAGCMFIGLPSGQQAMIQRYIIKLDRERHAKLAQ
ncbi:MAG: flagellar brake protein [Sulfuricella sp.]